MPYFAMGLLLLLILFFVPEISLWLPGISEAK